MTALDIPPHPDRSSRLALGLLALVAAAAFMEGFVRQYVDAGPAAPPPSETAAYGGIAEARPAAEPTLQVAEAPPKPRHAAETQDADAPDTAQLLDVPAVQPQAADAAATAPEPTPAAPPEAPADEPPH